MVFFLFSEQVSKDAKFSFSKLWTFLCDKYMWNITAKSYHFAFNVEKGPKYYV
jgi:hypothetical protein